MNEHDAGVPPSGDYDRKDNYFSIIPHWVIDSDISSGAIHLYAVLTKYADYGTRESFPSRKTLGRDINKSVRTVDAYLKELEDVGAIVVTRRKKPGSQENYTNSYKVITMVPLSVMGGDTGYTRGCNPLQGGSSQLHEGVKPAARGGEVGCAENDNHLTITTLSNNYVAASRDDVEALLAILDAGIEANGSRLPSRNKTNTDAMRLLLDKDNRPYGEVEAVIRFATTDEFWRANILSAKKLREKYDTLRLQMGRAAYPRQDRATSVYLADAERYTQMEEPLEEPLLIESDAWNVNY